MTIDCIRSLIYLLLLIAILEHQHVRAQSSKGKSKNKLQAIQYIEKRTPELTALSDSIWKLAESSFEEINSSRLLIEFLKKEGFNVAENVSGFQTVFVASYGEGKPVIGLFGEYDADPNASNLVVPRRAEREPGKNGHGGGHNLLGVGSVGTALAIKDLVARKMLKCTIRYYGTTAEGKLGSKTYLARDGYFNDLDLSLYWHPAPVTVASTAPWDALIDLKITMAGQKKNITQNNQSRPDATEALELLVTDLHALRSITNQGIMLNYNITQSAHSLNETPDSINVTIRVQCAKQSGANDLFEKISASVERIKEESNVQASLEVIRAMHQFLPNVTAMQAVYQNLQSLGPIHYTEKEIQFVTDLQQHLGIPTGGIQDKILPFSDQSSRESLYGYASDIGDASWIAPEIYFVVTSLPGVAMHQWPGTIFTGHSIGHKGMIQASKALALTIIDYIDSPQLQKSIREDFERRRQSYRYHSFLPGGPPQITKSLNSR
jgi:aminobenzoyl-glutamate utilization protein B